MSEALVRGIADNSPDPLLVFDPDGLLSAASPAARELLGLRRDPLRLADLLADPADAATLLRRGLMRKAPTPARLVLAEARASLRELRVECWRIGGVESAWMGVRVIQSGARLGGFVQLTATIDALNREIRAKDRALEALREQQAESRRIEEEAGIGTWRWDETASTPSLSPMAERLLQVSEGAVLDLRAYLRRVVDADRARVVEALRRLQAGPKALDLEHRVRSAQGTRTLRVGAELGVVPSTGRTRALGFVQDVTERREAEANRRRDRERLASVLEAVAGAVVLCDAAGTITLFNSSAETLFGWPAQEAVGAAVFDLFPAPIRRTCADAEALVAELSRQGPGVAYLRLFDRSGRVFPAEVVAAAVESDDERLYALTVRDATERERFETRMREAAKLESIANLTGGIAHDFNNLLTIIVAGTEECLDDVAPGDALHEPLEMSLKAARRGSELTRKLLSFSRRQVLAPRPIDLEELVGDCVRLARRAVEEHVHIEFEPGGVRAPVLVDPGELEAAVLNLVVNARDAMPLGGRVRIVTAVVTTAAAAADATHDEGPYALVRVEDDGEGMPADVVARAFDPFFTTKDIGKGSGLGLSHVHGFAHQSGGHVRLDSEPGRGTAVSIFLPFAAPIAAVPQRPESVTQDGRGRHVLMVEDDPQVRDAMGRLIETLGYRVTVASAPHEALALLDGAHDVDLVVSDMVMPGGMSGVDLLDALDERGITLPFLLVSGYAGEDVRERLGDRPHVAVAGKPLTRAELGRALGDVLRAST